MTKERWQDILSQIKDRFSVEDEGKERLEEEGGVDIEYIVFAGPIGKMRLEFITKPLIINKKTIYSHRVGATGTVEYEYSPVEKVYKLDVYKWDENQGDWLEIDNKFFK